VYNRAMRISFGAVLQAGLEAGQLAALSIILILMRQWRQTARFIRHAVRANAFLVAVGFLLMGYQLAGYFMEQTL